MRPSKNRDKPLILFFVIAFGLAWMLMSLPVAQNYGYLAEELPLELLLIIGSWVPNIAAFIVIGFVIKRKGGIKNLLLGWTKWKMHIQKCSYGVIAQCITRSPVGNIVSNPFFEYFEITGFV